VKRSIPLLPDILFHPVKGDGNDKKEVNNQVNQLQTIINYLEENQKNNPSPQNQDKLKKS